MTAWRGLVDAESPDGHGISLYCCVCSGERSLRLGAQGVQCGRWGARTVAKGGGVQGRQLWFQQLSPVEAPQGLGQASAFISPTWSPFEDTHPTRKPTP